MDKNYPESPHILSTDVGAWDEYHRLRDLRKHEGLLDLQQRMNPSRDITLGQVANISGHDPEDIASPSQMQRSIEPSSVPHYRSVPTMTNGPEVQGPYDIRQQADVDGREQPVTQHYPAMGGQDQAVPQVRRQASNLTLPGGPTSPGFDKPISTLQEEEGAPQRITRIDTDAPADRFQQMLATSSLERETKWPRGMGGGGAGTLQAKIQALVQSGIPEDEARQYAVLGSTAGDKTENIKARTRASGSRADNLDMNTDLSPQKFEEQQRQNSWAHDYKNRQLNLMQERHREGAERGQQSNELGWARLNNRRWYEDNLLAIYGDVNKAGRFAPEESDALHRGMGFLQTMKERDLTPDEETMWGGVKKFLHIAEPPHYTWQPRPPLTPPTKGTAAPMSRGSAKPGTSQGSQQSSPVQIKDEAEYNKLAPGTSYIDPKGVRRTKQ